MNLLHRRNWAPVQTPAQRMALLLLLAGSACTSPAPASKKPECRFHDECANGAVCFQGKCQPTVSCLERRNCRSVPVCADNRCICGTNNRCLPVCLTDNDCGKDGQCLDGVCERYPQRIGGAPPPVGPRHDLKVGLSRVDLDYPIGVSLAGYAGRVGPHTPYQAQLGGSNAWLDRPDVRAIAFDDGDELFVLLRIPTCWSTDEMLAATAAKVAAKTGVNLLDHLITSAPHSHSLPARYWHLLKGYNFGLFGYDEFQYEVFDRLTSSFAEAVIMALDDRQPARFGYTVLDDFDPMDRIHILRRPHTPALANYLRKDDRMLLMRVDDLQGRPRAILTNFGLHGTVFDGTNPIVTGDAPGAVEVALTLGASAMFDRQVLGFFLQGDAGDLSPAERDLGHQKIEQIQLIGKRAWDVMAPAIDRIATRADIKVRIMNGRIPISHAALGYRPGEFYDAGTGCEGSAAFFRYGSFQCVEMRREYRDGDLACVFSVECLTDGFPIPQFMKTSLAVVGIGDLVLATMPGEPLSQFGRDLSDRLVQAVPGARTAAVLGYSQDHHFYLLNAPDWLTGGYEASRDIWGWRMAPYFADKSIEIAAELAKPARERHFDGGDLKPMVWTDSDADKATVPWTETADQPGRVLRDVGPTIERFVPVELAWSGGDPGLDRPHVTLEVEHGGTFESLRRKGGWLYDDSYFAMIVSYEGRCTVDACMDHVWQVVWEEEREFPPGRYRLRADGRAKQNGAVMPYRALSSPFVLAPSSYLRVEKLEVAGGRLTGTISDPPALEYVAEGDHRRMRNRGHLLRSTEVPSELGAPLKAGTRLTVSGTVRASGAAPAALGGQVSAVVTEEPRSLIAGYDRSGAEQRITTPPRATSRFTIELPPSGGGASAGRIVTLTLTDPWGNSGTVTATIAP